MCDRKGTLDVYGKPWSWCVYKCHLCEEGQCRPSEDLIKRIIRKTKEIEKGEEQYTSFSFFVERKGRTRIMIKLVATEES